MLDKYNRRINYLRISVTDRCNLRCIYCMPEEGVPMMVHKNILSFEEIVEVAREAVAMGVDKVRLTGGEPLVRKGITNLVEQIAAIDGVRDLGMTTNGVLLSQCAHDLKRAGLNRVNISLDTLSAERYSMITRGGDIEQVFAGVNAAREAGLLPVKINCVVKTSSQEPDALAVADWARREGLMVRFIHQMNLEQGEFSVVEGGDGGDCVRCNRLRLTADGMVKPCLFSDIGFSVRTAGAREALLQALANKPECGTKSVQRKFYNIGG